MKIEMTSVQKLARVLKILVTITFVCNLIALLLVPFISEQRSNYTEIDVIVGLFQYDFDGGLAVFFDSPWYQVWQKPYTAMLTVFLWACGICTAVILWQARRVLDTVLKGETFTMGNSANMKRAGICCLIISTAALVRLIWGLIYYGDLRPLVTYNALFVPVFFMGFLLCTVMSALFRQAAELKEENDLTI